MKSAWSEEEEATSLFSVSNHALREAFSFFGIFRRLFTVEEGEERGGKASSLLSPAGGGKREKGRKTAVRRTMEEKRRRTDFAPSSF